MPSVLSLGGTSSSTCSTCLEPSEAHSQWIILDQRIPWLLGFSFKRSLDLSWAGSTNSVLLPSACLQFLTDRIVVTLQAHPTHRGICCKRGRSSLSGRFFWYSALGGLWNIPHVRRIWSRQQPGTARKQNQSHRHPRTVLRHCCCHRKSWCVRWDMGYVSLHPIKVNPLTYCSTSSFPSHHRRFRRPEHHKRKHWPILDWKWSCDLERPSCLLLHQASQPRWHGSRRSRGRLPLRSLSNQSWFSCHQFRQYLEENGFDTSAMGLPGYSSDSSSAVDATTEKKASVEVKTESVWYAPCYGESLPYLDWYV